MAKFADIVRSHRKKDKGVLGTLTSAIGQKSLEKIDPRNYLFNEKGTLTALFPKLKGYKAKTSGEKLKTETKEVKSTNVEQITSRLDAIGDDAQIIARNFIVLPHIARDMNVMRQNIGKLVKAEQIKPTAKADMYFLRAKEREAAYEAQQDNSPTKVGDEKKKTISSGNWADTILAGFVIGGLTAMFFNEEFRKKALELLEKGMEAIGLDMKNIYTGLLAVLGGIALGYVAFKVTAMAITAMIMRTTGGLGRFLGMTTILTALAVGATQIDKLFSDNKSETNESDNPATDGKQSTEKPKGVLGTAIDVMKENPGAVLGTAVAVDIARQTVKPKIDSKVDKKVVEKLGGKPGYNAKAERFVRINPQTGAQTFVKGKDLPLGKIMERFRTFAVKASSRGWMTRIISKVAARLGISIALKVGVFLTGLAAAPFTAGLSLLLNIASGIMLAYDIYLLYDLFFGDNSLEDELEKEDSKDNTKPTPAEAEAAKQLFYQTQAPGTAKAAIDFFMKKGWTREQAMGIVANLEAESGFDPNILGDSGKAYGIAQWRDNRRLRFQKVYGKPIEGSSFQEQLEYVNWELNNTEFTAAAKLRGARTAADAASIVDEYYERSKGIHRNKRMQIAQSYQNFETSGTLMANVTPPRTSSVPIVVAQNRDMRREVATNYNIDKRTFNNSQETGGSGSKSAEPYDQLFAMLFMPKPA